MPNRADVALALLALSLAVPGFCQSAAPPEAKPARTQVDGMKTFYEPDAVKKEGEVLSFRMYPSHDPLSKVAGTEYSINCKTQEISIRQKSGEWDQPLRVLAGEQLYPIAKKLCGWGPGFWNKLMD